MASAAVTGASRGIGRATALALARAGYRVIALARTRSLLETLALEGPNGSIVPIQMDITDEEQRRAAVERIMDETGGSGVDVLVNNAGYGQGGAIEEVNLEALRHQFEVNLFGLVAFAQPFIGPMRERGSGRIVNISSAAGRFSSPFLGVYSASKFALEAISDAMRRELAPFGVKVALIEPGPIKTHFGQVVSENEAHVENSPYTERLVGYRRAEGGSHLFTRQPDLVARVILRAIHARNPKPRYRVTFPAHLAELGRLLPDRLVDAAIERAF